MPHPLPSRAFSHASRHARSRIHQRCNTSEQAILDLLDAGACVDLGRKPGCNRRHLLFWSSIDQAAMVALRDADTGTLVTVLPLQYHAKLAWTVAADAVERARRLAAQRLTGPGRLHLKLHFLGDHDGPMTQGAWQSSMDETPTNEADIERFVREHGLLPSWRKAIAATGIMPERILGLSLRRGADGERMDVPEALVETLRRKLAKRA